MNTSTSPDIRPSPIAGTWYPGQTERLAEMVDAFLQSPLEEPVELDKSLRGVLSPHAGLKYSGGVAGKSMRYTQNLDVELVVIVGPSHRPYPAGLLSSGHSHYQTPLGLVPVAHHILEELAGKVDFLPVRNDSEHSIEIELPFLQRTLGDNFEFVPLAMLDQSWPAAQRLGLALAEILADKKVLLVASSDLSHFYRQEQAKQLDKVVLDAVEAYKPEEVVRAEKEGRGFACGHGAIAAVMVAIQKLGGNTAKVVGYATSGDVTHDMRQVVGYGAALFS